MLDLGAETEASLQGCYYFAGQRYSDHEFDAALARLAPRILSDASRCSARVSRRRHTPADREFDHLSIREYLETLDTEPWVRQAIEVAYVTVYGLNADEQSTLNLLSLIGGDAEKCMSLFGDSDERYKVRDGSGQVTDGLAQRLQRHLYLGHRLVRLSRGSATYKLCLERRSSRTVEVEADAVVLALPFTMLRQVDCGGLFSAHKQRAIDELGYGNNSKLMLGLHRRAWQDVGFDGGVYTDLSFQSTWECSRRRVADPAIFTYFLGGNEGSSVGIGAGETHARRYMLQTDQLFPGFSDAWTGFVRRVHWPSEPFALGSYTCYRTGQWTRFAGEEAAREGNVYFAGEHCATASQGYMDGAVRTGREAALAILRRLS